MEDIAYNLIKIKAGISVVGATISDLESQYYKRQRIGTSQFLYDKSIEELRKEIDEKKTLLNKLINELASCNASLKNQVEFEKFSKEKFDVLKIFAEQFISFIAKLHNDKNFCDFLMKNEAVQKLNYANAEIAIRNIFMMEIAKCFNQFSDLKNSKTKEFLALLYLQSKAIKPSYEIEYENISLLYEHLEQPLQSTLKTIESETIDQDIEGINFFKLATLLGWYDPILKIEYLSNMYQFSSIVVKADGVVSTNEENTLKRIMALNETLVEEKVRPNQEEKFSTSLNKQTVDEILQELQELTGLDGVKKEINTLINFIKIQSARKESGLKTSSLSYHIVFTGNPGTGKTTVARIVAKIYKSLGVLTTGQLIETDRSGLIAEYVGQTAIKVNKVVDSALNGVLFIDEAYSLAGGFKEDFGKEAVATLIKRMEDDRDKLIVIIAGYSNEMNEFIETNPGFKSRFNRYIEFTDYTPTELYSIFESQCTKLDYNLTGSAKTKLTSLLERSYEDRDHSFGNGRFVRNIFEKTLEKQANRIASIPKLDKEILTTVTENDIP